MKKFSLFILFLLIIFISVSAPAKTFDVSLATTGTTTVANGGVSTFIIDNITANYDLFPQINRYYNYGFQLTGVTPYDQQIQDGGNWSGATYTVFAKFKSNSTMILWDDVEEIPIIKNQSIDSSVSPFMVWFTGPSADLMRLYFETSGVTPMGSVNGKLIASEIPVEPDLQSILIKSNIYVINTSSGVSSILTVPEGTRITNIRTTSDIAYRLDATNPGISGEQQLTSSQLLILDSRKQALDLRFREWTGGSGTSVFVEHYTR